MTVLFNRRKYMVRRRSPQGAPSDIADATITVADSVTYTGTARYPAVTVVYDGATLVVNTHYTLNYVDNTELGAATVTVTGIGDFTGSVIKTFQIVSSGGGDGSWADFDLSKLGDAAAAVPLRDSGATYESGSGITLYGIQTLPDDSIFFAAQAQGHPYIWGFDDGHAFEVEHFKSSYVSKGRATGAYKGGVLANDGGLLYDFNLEYFSAAGAYKTVLDSPYELSTSNARNFIGHAGLLGIVPYRMQFSSDGGKIFYKGENNTVLYHADLSTPWNIQSMSAPSTFALNGLLGLPYGMRESHAFQFSPDGKAMLFSYRSKSSDPVDDVHCLVKLSLATPYDLSTASVHSYKHLFNSDYYINGIAVNNAGTKLILFTWYSAERLFREYDLTA